MTLFPLTFVEALVGVGLVLAAGAAALLLFALIKDLKDRNVW